MRRRWPCCASRPGCGTKRSSNTAKAGAKTWRPRKRQSWPLSRAICRPPRPRTRSAPRCARPLPRPGRAGPKIWAWSCAPRCPAWPAAPTGARCRASCARSWRRSVAEPDAIDLVLDVALESVEEEDNAAFAERVLQRAVQMQRVDLPLGTRRVYVSLVLTDDAGIAALNREFRGVDAPTDVLSFPQLEAAGSVTAVPADAPLLLGDIVVSLQRVEAQAHEYGHARVRELGFLLVHGLLHLLGYDHETPDEAAAMQARQEAILHALGLHRDGAR